MFYQTFLVRGNLFPRTRKMEIRDWVSALITFFYIQSKCIVVKWHSVYTMPCILGEALTGSQSRCVGSNGSTGSWQFTFWVRNLGKGSPVAWS